MAFQFAPAEPHVERELRRIARAELTEAIAHARAESHSASPLHGLRKAVKKTRGLLRLVAPVFPDFTRENAVLREAANGISPLRDAEVMRLTLAGLIDDSASGQAARLFLDALPPLDVTPDRAALDRFADTLTAVHARAEHWELKESGWKALAPGLETTLREARKRMERARRTRDDEHLHAWRSRIKHHWYHARLLLPIWPEMMEAHSAIAERLGEMLGDHHDLYVIELALPGPLSPAQSDALAERLEVEQRRIEAAAFPLGARLLAEPPEALSARWGDWHALWRAETKHG